MKKKYLYPLALACTLCLFTACSDDDEVSVKQETTETELIVSGVWKSGEVVHLDRHLVIPEGQSLTIEPGVTVIVSEKGVGVNLEIHGDFNSTEAIRLVVDLPGLEKAVRETAEETPDLIDLDELPQL